MSRHQKTTCSQSTLHQINNGHLFSSVSDKIQAETSSIKTALPNYIYLVTVCGFTFEFNDLDHMETVKNWFAKKIHPSTRLPNEPWLRAEHDCAQRWHERLPARIKKSHKRDRVVKALEEALKDFRADETSS